MTRDILAALIVLALFASGRACTAEAQPSDDALFLAQLSAHEAGLGALSEPAAIYAVAVEGGRRTGMTWARWLRVHSRRFAAGRIARTWTLRLDREGSDPRAGVTWARHRDRWLAMLAAADAAVASEPVCSGAVTWGSDADLARVTRLGRRYVEVDCGTGTVNHFLAVRR